jgi:hypothetical protein
VSDKERRPSFRDEVIRTSNLIPETGMDPNQRIDPEPKPAPKPPAKEVAAVTFLSMLTTIYNALNVKDWPTWAKVVIAVPVLAAVVYYYTNPRLFSTGVALFPEQPALLWYQDSSSLGHIKYPSGTSYPRDGLAVFIVTWDEYSKNKDVLPKPAPQQSDFPVLAFCNSSGFDATAAPITVRRLADGMVLYNKSPVAGLVTLLTPTSGGYRVYLADGSKVELSEREWVERYMGLPYTPPAPTPAPADLEKLSDAELKKLGYERLTAEEYQKRFGKAPPGSDTPPEKFPMIRNPVEHK